MVTYLYAWRKNLALTQGEAAQSLGIPRLTYCLIESGRLSPSSKDWDALRARFGSEAENLLLPVTRETAP